MKNLETRFREDVTTVEWQYLISHAQRDAIIFVTKHLDIIEVGVAIAQDDINSVQHWIDKTLIHKPSTAQLTTWNTDSSISFNTLIVQPFVLIQVI
ncbi:DUF2288 domain-containing protein [Cyanobacterium sp. uoEpiScrs1]|uniref:DUF2288 domain-containing protein n=1 Tax=Cyanobacterium sp. uoEpiScrs1 TaxID=2976343 RepID=UPI00226A975E|nr:DUF2288 domain-containing protein [Cyanobacterium sp. uoEpiScrs1]